MAGAMRKMGIYLGLVEDDDLSGEDQGDYPMDSTGDYPGEYADYVDPREKSRAEHVAVVSPVRRPRAERAARAWSAGATRAPVGNGAGGASAASGATAVDVYDQRAAHPAPEASAYRITTLHPRTYNEARTIGEHFRESVPVIMNLTEMDDADAKRLVDFAAGLSFGLRGSIERVTNKVFLLSPQNVSVTAEDKARIVEGGFFNQS